MATTALPRNVFDARLFDAFLFMALTLYSSVFLRWDFNLPRDYPLLAGSIVIPLALVGLWFRWRSAPETATVTVLISAALCFLAFLITDGMQGFPLLWAALLQLVFTLNRKWASVYVWLVSLVSLGMHFGLGHGVLRAATEAGAVMLMMECGLTFAVLLQRAASIDKERELAIVRLKKQLDTSQDLVINQERTRIAQTLHDGLGHKLTAVCMSLDYISRAIITKPARAVEEAMVARELTSEAIDDMRKVVRTMTPVSIGDNPVDTIAALARSFSTTSLDVEFDSEVPTLDEERGLLALRFAQESLTNVIRHSNATRVTMQLRAGDPLSFTIQDNGNVSAQPTVGFGIASLQHRAADLGGHVTLDTSHGFALTLTMPQPVLEPA